MAMRARDRRCIAVSKRIPGSDDVPSGLIWILLLSMGESVVEAECGMHGEFLRATAADIDMADLQHPV